jgi:hypothetical protein
MRRTAIASAAVGFFAAQAASLAEPQSYQVSLAAIETDGAQADVNGATPAETRPPAVERPTTGNPLWAIPISKLSATRDRPLFSASRRPRAAAVVAAPAPPPPTEVNPPPPATPPYSLVGTIIGENGRIAILLDENSKTATGVREGESASGWILRTVEPRSVVLDGSGHTVTLDLPEPTAQDNEDQAPPRVARAPWKRKFRFGNPADNPDNTNNPDNTDNTNNPDNTQSPP